MGGDSTELQCPVFIAIAVSIELYEVTELQSMQLKLDDFHTLVVAYCAACIRTALTMFTLILARFSVQLETLSLCSH